MAWTEMGTYEKINYSLRPAKNIERKMMFEIAMRLSIIDHLINYRYIGFGSAYFSDFILAHKALGINDLVSIERDDEDVNDRFRFNKPYSCIDLIFGDSKVILPQLNLSKKKSIVWLDYDKHLNLDMFEDITTFFREAQPWSMFAITINAEPHVLPARLKGKKTESEYRLDKAAENIGKTRIPHQFLETNLGFKENSLFLQEIINNEINNVLNIRNGGTDETNKIRYKQIFNFLYKDGALMLTIGGIIFKQSEESIYEKLGFENIDFARFSTESLFINIPNLTYKEIRALDNLLPKNINLENGEFDRSGIDFTPFPILKSEDIINYAKVYRFFPNFAESTQ